MKYIDAEKLKERIEKLDMESCIPDTWDGFYYAIDSVLEVITSLQQKQPEVDLGKEIQSFWNANALEYRLGHVADINFLAYTARHFYELGLKARKEE